ncbi:MAG: hypothetical protein JXR60_10460 [Bacteroidales bacterium]|nr:hypothetical protein [Bacteroidales bacterium]
MKKHFLILLIPILSLFVSNEVKAQCNSSLVTVCSAKLSDDATYLKELRARLQAHESGQQMPVARFSLLLNKGNHYRFNICNAEEFEGQAILQLYDKDKLLGTSYFSKTKKHYPSFDFICPKTGVYKVLISFEDGKEGCAVGILSLVNK